LVLAVLVAPAQAQSPTAFSLSADSPTKAISPTGPTNIHFNVTLGCALILEGGQMATVTVTGTGPTWLTVGSTQVVFKPTDCAGTTPNQNLNVKLPGVLPVTPGPKAPGLVASSFDMTASSSLPSSPPAPAAQPVAFTVGYRANHTLRSSIQFPYTMTGSTLTWNVTIGSSANARTMIMMNDVTATAGSVSGLAPHFIDTPPGNLTFPVTFKAPDGDWSNATISFVVFSHWCLTTGPCGDPNFSHTYHWTIKNGGGGGGGGKKSPAPSALLMVGLLAGALVLRRRKAE
jgi:hypothetical protein